MTLDEIRLLASTTLSVDASPDLHNMARPHDAQVRLAGFAIAVLDELTAWRASDDREVEAAGHDVTQAIAFRLERLK